MNVQYIGLFQKAISDHISKRKPQGCKICSQIQQTENAKKYYTIDMIREIGKEKYESFYTYPDQEPLLMSEKLSIICPIHGEYKQVLRSHIQNNHHCNDCSYVSRGLERIKPLDTFIEQAKLIHGDKYDYSKFEYITARTKSVITCKSCKTDFKQTPHSHVNVKSGCFSCNVKSRLDANIHLKVLNKKILHLYVVELFNEKESFIKIGITSNTVLQRFRRCPYQVKIHLDLKLESEDAFQQEKEILKEYKDFKYNPLISFSGFTECVSKEILDDIVKVLLARNGQ